MPYAAITPEILAKRAAYKRKYREERLYSKGLTSLGKPVLHPERGRPHLHPTGCGCRDCLFPPVEWSPIVHRVVMGRR